MKKQYNLIYLLFILALNLSCVEKKSTEKEINKSELLSTSQTDTLKFTSGIRAIFQDSNGNYWFGSHNEGVSYFNGKSFEYFTTIDGLSDNQIRSIQEDKDGNIWIGTANGVCTYNGKTITNHTPSVSYDLPGKWIKTDNDLWFAAGNREGVYRYDGKKMNYLAFSKPKNVNPDYLHAVTNFSVGKNDMLWIATYSGIFGYNGNQFTIINEENLGIKKETGLIHIRSVLEDSKGRLWIGNNGIGVLLKEGETTINFSEKHNLIHPTSSRRGDKSLPGTLEHVFAIEEDAEGNIWFGDRDTGPWKYDGKTMTNYTIDKNLKSQMVWAIYKDNNNSLLFGTEDGNVFKFNGKTFERQF